MNSTAMPQQVIESLLRQKIGLDANSIGSSTIARAIRVRMESCRLTDMAAYLQRVQTSIEELEQLIENVVVPETWFFRDREPFVYLSHYVSREWLPKNPGSVLRVLSVPCSTGEEPYSIAIALFSAGLSPTKFHVDAVDISKQSLLKAKRAVYTQNSFRGVDSANRDSYFKQTETGFELCDLVKSQVNFLHGNLLDRNFLADKEPYDIIFCRNLLIYLDGSGKEQAMERLYRFLAANGVLFLGHSEAGQISPSQFVPVRHPLAFAYRKIEEQKNGKVGGLPPGFADSWASRKAGERASVTTQRERNMGRNSPPRTLKESPPKTLKQLAASTPPHLPNQSAMLENARALADAGQLDEAASLCETYLSQNRISESAYLLLGQIHQARGNDEQAEQCFQKAVYLEPKHYQALIHLARIKEHRGDIATAAVLRQRIQRLQSL